MWGHLHGKILKSLTGVVMNSNKTGQKQPFWSNKRWQGGAVNLGSFAGDYSWNCSCQAAPTRNKSSLVPLHLIANILSIHFDIFWWTPVAASAGWIRCSSGVNIYHKMTMIFLSRSWCWAAGGRVCRVRGSRALSWRWWKTSPGW